MKAPVKRFSQSSSHSMPRQVEMIGRLVEHEHVRLLRDCADDRRAATLASAGGFDRPRQIEPDLVGDGSRLMRLGRIRPVQHPVEQGRMVAHVRILLEQHDAASRDDRSPALVRIDQSREALQQRRLADAVAADQRQPVARADVNVEMAEQPPFALNEPEVFVRECRRRHGGPDRGGFRRSHPLVRIAAAAKGRRTPRRSRCRYWEWADTSSGPRIRKA